ncbi:MAG: hypothetical protein ACRC4L_02585, partial [Mycoplasma sp.]
MKKILLLSEVPSNYIGGVETYNYILLDALLKKYDVVHGIMNSKVSDVVREKIIDCVDFSPGKFFKFLRKFKILSKISSFFELIHYKLKLNKFIIKNGIDIVIYSNGFCPGILNN